MTNEISLKEALELCISRGMTRRQAERWLAKNLANGKIPASGVMTESGPQGEFVSSGRRLAIPVEFWKSRK